MDIYDTLINGIDGEPTVSAVIHGLTWTAAELSDGRFGIALRNQAATVHRRFGSLEGLGARLAAQAVRSWNLEEASEGMAVINAFYNTPARLAELDAGCGYDKSCTQGMATEGAKIALIGHLKLQPDALKGADKVYIIEREPKSGDYPDPACEYILPECGIVIMTASAAINKTLPRLLKLSENAKTVVIGPSAPLCPEILQHGITRVSGMVVRDIPAFKEWMMTESGNPYPYGDVFMI